MALFFMVMLPKTIVLTDSHQRSFPLRGPLPFSGANVAL